MQRESSGESMDWARFWQDRPEIMGHRPPFPLSTIQTLIADKAGPYLINPHSLRACVNGARNMVSLVAIRIDKRVVWRVDGLATILAGSARNHGPHSPLDKDNYPDPNRFLRMDQISPISTLSRGVCKWRQNMVFLSAIRIAKGSSGESMDWPRFWQDPTEIMGRQPPFPHVHHPDPNHG